MQSLQFSLLRLLDQLSVIIFFKHILMIGFHLLCILWETETSILPCHVFCYASKNICIYFTDFIFCRVNLWSMSVFIIKFPDNVQFLSINMYKKKIKLPIISQCKFYQLEMTREPLFFYLVNIVSNFLFIFTPCNTSSSFPFIKRKLRWYRFPILATLNFSNC